MVIFTYIIYYHFFEDKNDSKNIEIGQVENNKIMNDIRLSIIGYDTIDPIISNNQNVQDIAKIIYEPLLDIEKDYKIKFCLANEWAKINEKEYIIKLKENVKWQNGNKITSNDIKYTIEKIKQTPNSIYKYNVEHISSVKVIDERTLKLSLDKEVLFFEYLLNFPIMCSNNDQNRLTTSGMYYISEITEKNIVLKANENYWNIENINPITKTIKINFYNSIADVYNEFRNGNIDMFTTSNVYTDESMGFVGYNTKRYKSRQYDYIAINTTNNLLNRKEVRQAISLSINKEAILQEVFEKQYEIANFPLDNGSYLYSSNIANVYDDEKAKQILNQSGWEFTATGWQKNEKGKKLTLAFNLIVSSTNENRIKVAEIIKKQLEEFGIGLNIKSVDEKTYYNYLENKDYDMILTGIKTAFSPDLTTFLGKDNLALYKNEEINTILSEVKDISNEDLLKQKYNRIIEITNDEIPYIGLYFEAKKLIYSKNIVGNIDPTAYNVFYNMDTWYRKE